MVCLLLPARVCLLLLAGHPQSYILKVFPVFSGYTTIALLHHHVILILLILFTTDRPPTFLTVCDISCIHDIKSFASRFSSKDLPVHILNNRIVTIEGH
ncbi:hypothetical protein OROMI_032426 [Orobanche minor]